MPFFDRANEIFHVSLRPGLRSPFKPDDELSGEEESENEGGEDRDRGQDAGGEGGGGRLHGVYLGTGWLAWIRHQAGELCGRRLRFDPLLPESRWWN